MVSNPQIDHKAMNLALRKIKRIRNCGCVLRFADSGDGSLLLFAATG